MDRGASRWRHMVYLAVYALVGTFVLGFFAVITIESSGPVEVDSGRVVDRIEAEGEICSVGPRRNCRPYPAFSIVGERADGTTWSVNGPAPYEVVRAGEPVEISTSTVTGRIVALESERGTWSVGTSGFRLIAYAWLGLALFVGIGIEFGRRKRDTVPVDGPFRLSDIVAVPPAILLALFGLWSGLFSGGEDFSGETAVEEFGTLIAAPLDFDIRANADGSVLDDDGHVNIGRYSGNTNLEVVVVPRIDLSPDVAASIEAVPAEVVAVPIIGRKVRPGPVEFLLVEPRDLEGVFPDQVDGLESIDCPESVLSYPTVLGEDRDVRGGFICFDAGAVSAESVIRVTAGTGLFIDRTTHLFER